MTATEALESYLIIPTEIDKKRYFLERLVNWRNERPWYSHFFQWNARRKIVNALKRDMDNFASHKKLTGEQSVALVAYSFKRLDEKKPGQLGILGKISRKDSVTHKDVFVEIGRTQEGYYAQEIYDTIPKPVSKAVFNRNGQSALTLNFSHLPGEQNPAVEDNLNMPIAAGAVFNFLVNSIINKVPKA